MTKHVLVIDDDPTIAKLAAAALTVAGVAHQVEQCSDGGQGRLLAAQGWYDLVILDLMMPLVSGIEALAGMRNDPRTARTPVVVLTGRDDPGTRRYVEGFDITAYVVKPISLERLGRLLRAALEAASTGVRWPELTTR